MSDSKTIYLIVGVPGVGKTWITNQVAYKFDFVHHDLFIGQAGDAYLNSIFDKLKTSSKPLLIEAPFSVSQYKDPLEKAGHKVIPLFIIEDEKVVASRYEARDKKPIPKGHLTRMQTYAKRAKEWNAFQGTSTEVLEYLKKV